MAATKEQKRAYYHRNKERILATQRERMRGRWPSRAGRDRRHSSASYRAQKLKATPPWHESAQVQGLYKLATYLVEEYGKEIHVDHIIPLKGENVCGLHCMDNLQLLYAEDNIRKSNKVEAA